MTTKKRFPEQKYTAEKLNELARSLKSWIDGLAKRSEFGMLGDWAFRNDFSPKNFKRYADKSIAFNDAYQYAKEYQEFIISRGALTKDLDSKFSVFFLCSNHSWKVNGDGVSEGVRDSFSEFVHYMNTKNKGNAVDKNPDKLPKWDEEDC